ncbi:hypothetical protein K3181_13820 [Qipengyuania sp. YG27]|uniref:DUF2147 domain-containing protein n=1 Tax=Qipengyuania mesophila TaxID=2867246 RepID=A0ABS7JXY6_9SPHN|nr:hypothetical protein [Qipengyuania mesophila]MBX7502519.1 hypothetical protein [Qipengyuania mesophila]
MIHSLALGLAALLPLAIGPSPASATNITAKFCGGGTVEIPIRRDGDPTPPCTMKGCHAGSCRKRIDLRQ